MLIATPRPILVLTPGVTGADGLSRLSREVITALAGPPERAPVELWSLTDEKSAEQHEALSALRVRSARGSRRRFASWGIREAWFPQRGRTVVALHAHLAPVTLPLVCRGARLVHFIVGIEAWKPLSSLQQAALRRATLLVAISRHSEVEFRKANPRFGDARIAVSHPGLSAPETAGGEHDDGGYALIVGRMSAEERYKGHDQLIEVWQEVLGRFPEATLLVAGDGDDRPRLERKANELALGRAVRFVGKVSDEELDRLYRRCAFFVMPSRHEGFGFVFLEAMHAGKACIGARGAASEVIVDGVTGLVVSPSDRDALRAAVERLWSDPVLRREMGSRASARFRSYFTAEHFAGRLRTVLDEAGQEVRAARR